MNRSALLICAALAACDGGDPPSSDPSALGDDDDVPTGDTDVPGDDDDDVPLDCSDPAAPCALDPATPYEEDGAGANGDRFFVFVVPDGGPFAIDWTSPDPYAQLSLSDPVEWAYLCDLAVCCVGSCVLPVTELVGFTPAPAGATLGVHVYTGPAGGDLTVSVGPATP